MKQRMLRSQRLRIDTNLLYIQSAVCGRHVHSSRPRQSSASPPPATIHAPIIAHHTQSLSSTAPPKASPLSILPTSAVLRTYLITSLSSSPFLLGATAAVLRRMASANNVFFGADKNPLLRWALKKTFYAQFCAGENKKEVQKTTKGVKRLGYNGVILEYALEVLDGEVVNPEKTAREIEIWKRGMLESVEVVSEGDFVGLKWTGLGTEALQRLNANKPPTPAMESAIHEVCDLAASKNVSLLPGAELSHTNVGLDNWTLDLQRQYNARNGQRPVMYTTYQCYLKSTPGRLARDLAIARKEGFTLGIKLVRGAYLASEPRDLVCSSKEETDAQYDALMEAILRRRYNGRLKPVLGDQNTGFPAVALMIATHNAPSVQKAQWIRKEQAENGEQRIACSFAQLQGMADEISAELVQAARIDGTPDKRIQLVDRPMAYKCATWGTLTECLQFLLRRAAENQDAAGRTADTRRAMGKELWRRWMAVFGLA